MLDRIDRRRLLLDRADRHHHVGTGLQGQHGGPIVPVAVVNGFHDERIGDHHAVVAPFIAQHAAEDRARQRRRMPRIDLRVNDVRRHHRRRFIAEREKRRKLHPIERLPGLVDDGQIEVRVDVRVAMPGKMLDAARDAFAQRPAHPRGTEARDVVRIRRETALGDYRILRVVVDVEHRGEIPVEADAPNAAGDCGAHVVRERCIAGGSKRHRGGRLRQERHAHDGAAFLVDADQCPWPHRLAQLGRERAHILFSAEVVAKEHDGSNVMTTQECRLRIVERLPPDADHDELARMEIVRDRLRAHRAYPRRSIQPDHG